jgi:hypothetical protein
VPFVYPSKVISGQGRVFSIDDAIGILLLELISQIRRVWRWLVNVSIAMIYVAPTVGQIGARRMGMPMACRLIFVTIACIALVPKPSAIPIQSM